MSEASHNPAKRVKTSSANTSIPVSPTQAPHASGYISASPYTNPYQTQYANNPTAFSYPQHGYVPHQQQLPQPIHQQLQPPLQIAQQADLSKTNTHKRRTSDIEDAPLSANSGMSTYPMHQMPQPQGLMSGQPASSTGFLAPGQPASRTDSIVGPSGADATRNMVKKGRTNTPWTPVEERRLKAMREAGNNWNEIAKTFPNRTEGSVKKHWYKDMHYAEFAEDEASESTTLLNAIKEYEANKWKIIGQKVGKPAKACEQYAKEHNLIGRT